MLTKFETKSARVKGKDLQAAASIYANVSKLTDAFPFLKKNKQIDCYIVFVCYWASCICVAHCFYEARYVLVLN